MTCTLILMRHAKSGWDDLSLPDHDRQLNKRGRASATAVGKWMHAKNLLPERLLCSSSARTRETFARLGIAPQDQEFRRDLYLASLDRMMMALRTASGATVLMLGHNPGIAELAERLVSTAPDHPRFFDYPTNATLVVSFDVNTWADIQFGAGQVEDFITPGDLRQ